MAVLNIHDCLMRSCREMRRKGIFWTEIAVHSHALEMHTELHHNYIYTTLITRHLNHFFYKIPSSFCIEFNVKVTYLVHVYVSKSYLHVVESMTGALCRIYVFGLQLLISYTL